MPARRIASEPLVVQRAEQERALPSVDSISSFEHNLSDEPDGSGPDLDALAREVYMIVKRRLRLEMRRQGKSR